jgi:succinoglycan biosynthesis transport protein ExoP
VREPVHSSGNEIILHTAPSVRSASRLLYLEPVSPTVPGQDGRSFLAEYWRVIVHHLPLLAVILVAGAALGLLISLWQTPVYQAKVTLELQSVDSTLNLRIGDLQNGSATISPESYLPTQVQILGSRTLQQRALAKIQNDNIHKGAQRAHRSSWRSALGFSKPQPVVTAGLAKVQTKVKVSDNTRILEITAESTDPDMAQAFANGLAEEYANANLEARFDAMNQARKWLSHQLEETREKLRKSEDDLQAYGRSSNLMFTASKESVEQEKLKQLQEELSRAQANRIEKQSAYRIASSSSADSVPQVIDNASLMGYQTQLAALRQQLAQLTSQYTPEHYKVKSLQAQIDAVEATFRKERSNILSRIRNEYKTALFRENLLTNAYRTQSKMVTQQTQKTVNYNILERDVETNRQMYESLLQKAKEADVATAFHGSNVRIIDPAERPALPFKPNLILNGSLGGLLGLFVGLVLITGRESFDRSFKAPGEISFHLNLPELGVIPAGGYIAMNGNGTRPVDLPANGVANPKMPIGSIELATWREKSSAIAESFRSTITSILFAQQNGGSPRVLFVSSAKRCEGKTTVVSNLGAALAEINQRVLLIDGDMRKPRLNEIFDVPNNWGLSDLLREKTSLRDCPLEALVKRTEIANLFLLTSGPGTHSISNLLYSNRMLELIQRVRGEFDTILIDTPPLLDISDARILGRLADAGIVVVRAGKTSREMASAVKRRLTEDGIVVLGTILNAWDLKSMSRYGYGEYQYTHDHV